jgi:hypothetical protein
MAYFDGTADKQERIGKLIGDTLAAILTAAVIIIITLSMITR